MNLDISLPDELGVFIQKLVKSGRYASSKDVVTDALRWMAQRDDAAAQEIGRLRKSWEEGLDSGDAGEIDFAQLKLEARARLSAEP